MSKRKILFVCTGNVFRSLSAELLLKKYLEENGIEDMEVSSAGTRGRADALVDPATRDALARRGIELPSWVSRPVTRELLADQDVVIAMASYHVAELEEELGFAEAVLFDEVASGAATSILDLNDPGISVDRDRAAAEEYIERVVRHIDESTPALYRALDERYTLFTDFITGRKKQNRGYDVLLLHETPHAAAFMASSIPEYEDAHVLVVPKKRYRHLHNVPQEIVDDLSSVIRLVGRVFHKKYDGYNVLLNNGREAGQNIFHVHFHVIPRRKGDDIEVQEWKTRPVPKEEFEIAEARLKELIDTEAAIG